MILDIMLLVIVLILKPWYFQW